MFNPFGTLKAGAKAITPHGMAGVGKSALGAASAFGGGMPQGLAMPKGFAPPAPPFGGSQMDGGRFSGGFGQSILDSLLAKQGSPVPPVYDNGLPPGGDLPVAAPFSPQPDDMQPMGVSKNFWKGY